MPNILNLHGRYDFVCRDRYGNVKWRDRIYNLVTTQGKNDILDKYLAGSAYTAAWYLLLKGTGTAVVGDTYASHASWSEITNYSQATRPAPVFAAASGGTKATSANVVYNITGTVTVAGCALVSNSTKGDTAGGGILYSAGDFVVGRPVVNGDILSATYTAGA